MRTESMSREVARSPFAGRIDPTTERGSCLYSSRELAGLGERMLRDIGVRSPTAITVPKPFWMA